MSFFGFDAASGSSPPPPPATADGDDEGQGRYSRIDELLEEKFKYGGGEIDDSGGGGAGGETLEEDGVLNDETFGSGAETLGKSDVLSTPPKKKRALTSLEISP